MTETDSDRLSNIQLKLNLPGRWHYLDLSGEDGGRASIEATVAELIGATDEEAKARFILRSKLSEAAQVGVEAGARALYLGHELAEGSPFPVTIAVYQPEELRIAPAIGTTSDEVLGVFEMAFDAQEVSRQRADGGNFKATRFVKVEHDDTFDYVLPDDESPEALAEYNEIKQLEFANLRVEYWCHIPTTKHLTLVAFNTQIAELQHLLVTLFDMIIMAALFVDADGEPVVEAFDDNQDNPLTVFDLMKEDTLVE